MTERGEWINIGPGSFPAPGPWLNVDVHEGDGVSTDVVVDDFMDPLAGFDNVQRVYMGHVLEHVPWVAIPDFLRNIEKRIAPGAEVCAVGPDVLRVIRRWHEGLEPEGWDLIESILENPWDRCYGETGYGLIRDEDPRWPYARHWWNCYESRVVFAFRQYTTLEDVTPQPIEPAALGDWPVTSYTAWQCAVTARKPA